MFLPSSSPDKKAVLMSREIRGYLCEATDCMIKASDAADNVGHGAPLSNLDPGSPTHTDVPLPFHSISMSGPTLPA